MVLSKREDIKRINDLIKKKLGGNTILQAGANDKMLHVHTDGMESSEKDRVVNPKISPGKRRKNKTDDE